MIRVLIVEDHPVFRDGLQSLVESAPGMTVIGVAGDGTEAMRAARDADVVLMDLNLPSMSGVEATKRIVAAGGPAVLVVTMMDDDATVVAALRAGARGYVLKDALGDDITAAIRTVAAGGAVFGAGVAARVLGGGITREEPDDGLTDRERQVLARIAAGETNAQIARALGLSLKTVQNYVSRILDKLQVSDRNQAAQRARGL